MKGLIFSSIRVEAGVLDCVLKAVENCEIQNGTIECAFYDDNVDPNSSSLLKTYVARNKNWAILPKLTDLKPSSYCRDGEQRGWTESTVDRVIAIKNAGLSHALVQGYDWVFLLDADLVMHRHLLQTLQQTERDIVSGIFWTRFDKNKPLLPNCWDVQTYSFRTPESLIRLREPGLYEVGGLGAATMIRREALRRGVSFSRIPNLDMWGEDKHFCVRAACLGLKLHVETSYPLFHVYTSSDLAAGKKWFSGGCRPEEIRCLLDENWESAIRKMFEKRVRAPEGSVRRKAASALRLIAQRLDPK